jgi:CheY-like chemotaxis protein
VTDATRSRRILLVEDNAGDVELAREAFGEIGEPIEIDAVPDSDAAIATLRRDQWTVGARTPGLVLLDLNLPGGDGWQVLEAIRADVRLRTLPVLILTSSEAEVDVRRAYDLGATCYVPKPITFRTFREVASQIAAFWFGVVRLPEH